MTAVYDAIRSQLLQDEEAKIIAFPMSYGTKKAIDEYTRILEHVVYVALEPPGMQPHPFAKLDTKPGEIRVMQPTEVVLRIVVEGAQVNQDGQ